MLILLNKQAKTAPCLNLNELKKQYCKDFNFVFFDLIKNDRHCTLNEPFLSICV